LYKYTHENEKSVVYLMNKRVKQIGITYEYFTSCNDGIQMLKREKNTCARRK